MYPMIHSSFRFAFHSPHRPDFKRDIASIGMARPDMNIHVYVSGLLLIKGLKLSYHNG